MQTFTCVVSINWRNRSPGFTDSWTTGLFLLVKGVLLQSKQWHYLALVDHFIVCLTCLFLGLFVVFFYYRRHVIPSGQPDKESQSPMASCWSLSRRRNQARSTLSASLRSRTRRYIQWKLIVCQLPPILSANEGVLKLIHWIINCLYVSSLLFCLPMKECSNYLCISKHFSPITGIGLGQG